MIVVRLLLLVVVVALGFGLVAANERRRPRSTSGPPVGLRLVSALGCHDCVAAEARLVQVGATFTKVAPDRAATLGMATFTVPSAFVCNTDGELVLARRGKSVLRDAELLAAAAEV
jgi:hypothetical protein